MEINNLRYLVVKITGKDKKGDRKQADGIYVRNSDKKTAIVAPVEVIDYTDIKMILHYRVGNYIASIEFPVDVKFENVPGYGNYSVCLTGAVENAFYSEIGARMIYACLDEDKIIAARPQDSAAPKQ